MQFNLNNKFGRKRIAVLVALAVIPSFVMAENAAAIPLAAETLEEVEVSAAGVDSSKEVADGYVAKRTTTATKTNTLLRDVPQSISVVTQDQIEDQAVRSIEDAVRYTPGIGMAQGEGNRDAVVFRGNQSTADFFVDGIRDDVQYYRDFYNTERIEVLKGPNGMIFGRGGSGGVINRVTKEATWDPIRELTLQAGAYDQRRASIDLGQAISEGAAFRINAMVEDANSYRDGVSLSRHGINPTITFLPTDKTKIVLSAEYFYDHRTADRGIPSFNGRPFSTDESTFFGNASLSPTETEVQNYSVLIEHAFDNGITLRNRTRYADYDKYYQNIFASAAVTNAGNVNIQGYRDDTQRENLFNQTDLLYTLNTGSVEHKLLAGVEMGHQDTDNFRLNARFNTAGGGGTTVVSAADSVTRIPVFFNNLVRDSTSETTVTGVYLQDQIIFDPKFQAIVGVRYDKFEVDFHNKIAGTPAADAEIDTTDEFLSPRIGLVYKPVEQVSVYTSYSEAYVPRAGEQLTSLAPNIANFDPEKFKNYEIGAKWDITPDLALTAAIFKLERTKVAITDPVNPAQQILIDGQETRGFELGFNGRITSAWSVIGGYTNQEAEITETQGTGAGRIIAGAELANTPRETLALWNRYDFNETWGAAIGVISRSEMYAATPTVGTQVILPGYTRVDGAIYAKLDESLRFQLNVENLFDKEYYLYAHNNNNISPGSPVAARATLIYDF